ncbi:MAG: hypothetical protein ACJA0S_001344 [Rickettsiales bacterium]|jgi:hypothetical protein
MEKEGNIKKDTTTKLVLEEEGLYMPLWQEL